MLFFRKQSASPFFRKQSATVFFFARNPSAVFSPHVDETNRFRLLAFRNFRLKHNIFTISHFSSEIDVLALQIGRT